MTMKECWPSNECDLARYSRLSGPLKTGNRQLRMRFNLREMDSVVFAGSRIRLTSWVVSLQ